MGSRWEDAVLQRKKVLQIGWKDPGEFLKGQQFESATGIKEPDGTHHAEPDLDKIWTTSIAKNARTIVACVGRENATNQLIAHIFFLPKGEFRDDLEVTVPKHQTGSATWKPDSVSLGFHKKPSESHVDLRIVVTATDQRNTRLESEN
jgi:hypothetical protein